MANKRGNMEDLKVGKPKTSLYQTLDEEYEIGEVAMKELEKENGAGSSDSKPAHHERQPHKQQTPSPSGLTGELQQWPATSSIFKCVMILIVLVTVAIAGSIAALIFSTINNVDNHESSSPQNMAAISQLMQNSEDSTTREFSNQIRHLESLLNETQKTVEMLKSQMSGLQSSIRTLQTSVDAVSDPLGQCYEDTVTCRVASHGSTGMWYLCLTNFTQVNIPGYHTLAMRCQGDQEFTYIDSTFLEVSGSMARCHCDVVGLTTSGLHEVFPANALPSGVCSLVITRCPLL